MRSLAAVLLLALAGCMPSYRMTEGFPPERSCPGGDEYAWYSPETAGDHDRLEDWCQTVGPPVVSLDPTADFGDLTRGRELDVISWNVDVGGGDLLDFFETELGLACDGSRSRFEHDAVHFALLVQEAFRRSNEIPESPPDPTIPRAVAEDPRPGERLDAVEAAARCGLSLVYVAAARNGNEPRDGLREDKGVAILSTLPLEAVLFMELPYEAARRVAVGATIRDETGVGLRVVNLHLISMAGPARALSTGNGSRLRQGLAVSDALEKRAAASELMATILAGDFNTWSNRETALRRLRNQFPDSPPPLGEGTHGSFPTDHILFRAGPRGVSLVEGSYVRLPSDYLSDHHPIRVQVRFPD